MEHKEGQTTLPLNSELNNLLLIIAFVLTLL